MFSSSLHISPHVRYEFGANADPLFRTRSEFRALGDQKPCPTGVESNPFTSAGHHCPPSERTPTRWPTKVLGKRATIG